MKSFFAAIIFTFINLIAASQEIPAVYNAASISADMKKDADAVYRVDHAVLNILSPSAYKFTVHQVITVLNSNGIYHSNLRLGIDKFNSVEKVQVKVFDASGKLYKSYGKKDFDIEAAYDGISLFTDDKVMKLKPNFSGFPYTIDVEYIISATGYIELPNWYISNHDASVENFRYQVSVPAQLDIRHRTLNFDVQPKVDSAGMEKTYVWEARNIHVKKREAHGFEPAQYLPQVEVAPNKFEYDGHAGSFKTWNEFGKWNFSLYEESTPLPGYRVNEIKSLVASIPTEVDKIGVLYKYLQTHMRYVSIQLGIGGFKPFPVNFVDDKRYGDCKALTNYMRYMLKVAGIKSYPALINAGENKIPADPLFPTSPFNHVILCIPGDNDTTWLECTSKNSLPGYLGSFTENKKALLLTEEGGIIVNTPRSSYKNNSFQSFNRVQINEEGDGRVVTSIQSTGDAASFFTYTRQLAEDEQREQLLKNLKWQEPEELEISFSGKDSLLTAERKYDKIYDFKAGSKHFIPVSFSRLVPEPLQVARREMDFLFPFPYEKTDTTVFYLSPKYTVESLPQGMSVTNEFASFKRSVVYDKAKNTIEVVNHFVLNNHIIPAASYLSLARFYLSVAELENEKFVIIKQ